MLFAALTYASLPPHAPTPAGAELDRLKAEHSAALQDLGDRLAAARDRELETTRSQLLALKETELQTLRAQLLKIVNETEQAGAAELQVTE